MTSFLAQESILPFWAQLGLAAIFVIAFITGQVVPGFLYKSAKDERDEERKRVDELEESIRERVIPALILSTTAIADATKLIDELEVLVKDTRDGLERQKQQEQRTRRKSS